MTVDSTAEASTLGTAPPVTESNPAESVGAGIARGTSLLALGTIASRILGFVQEFFMAYYFPRGLVSAFQIAITVPRDLYDLAISGHVNSAIVPVLSEYAANDRNELWRLVNLLCGSVMLILSGIVLLLEIFANQVVLIYTDPPAVPLFPSFVGLSGGRFSLIIGEAVSPATIQLTTQLLRITAPALLFLGMYAVLSGTLYALRRFTAPAFASAFFNGTLVTVIVLLSPVIGIERAAIGWLVGAVAQFGLQAIALRRSPIRFSVRGALRHPGVRRIALLYVPVMLSLIVDVLINRMFSYRLAWNSGEGSVAYMNWATSLREFPMGLVGTAISIAVLPTLARQALSGEQAQDFKDTLGQGIRLALALIVPATVGMFVLAGPLVGLLFERGQFMAVDTMTTALVLRLYLVGIPFAAVDLLLIFAFYARVDTMTPALIGIFSLACYMGIALLLQHAGYSFYGLMIADSMKFLIHMTLAAVLLRRRLGGLGGQRLPLTVLKVGLAAVLTGLVAYAAMRGLTATREPQGFLDRAILVVVPSFTGILTYIGMAYLLQIREFGWFVQMLRSRLRR